MVRFRFLGQFGYFQESSVSVIISTNGFLRCICGGNDTHARRIKDFSNGSTSIFGFRYNNESAYFLDALRYLSDGFSIEGDSSFRVRGGLSLLNFLLEDVAFRGHVRYYVMTSSSLLTKDFATNFVVASAVSNRVCPRIYE